MKPGTDIKGLINNALRKIGFDYVFETSFGGDVSILEQSAEFISRYKSGEKLPMFTSRCPAWVNYIEEFRPDLISNLLPVRSPHQIMGKLIKNWFADKQKLNSNRIHSVLISNCTAAKAESMRMEYASNTTPDVDFVLTTRELARLIRLNGIDMEQLEAEASDGPFLAISSAGKLLANSGGEMEATLRTIYRDLSKKELRSLKLSTVREAKGVREAQVPTPKGELSLAVVSGLKNAIDLLKLIDSGKKQYDFVEVLVCPEGCVNGGGQPIPARTTSIKARTKTILETDKNELINAAHKNSAVDKMYAEYAHAPGSDESKSLFHTKFLAKKVLK
jgi:iron only hydrogenase large subunit-like protein